MPDVIRFIARTAPEVQTYAIEDIYGNTIYVFNAALIRLFSEAFHARYEVYTSPDGAQGIRRPDGNWSEMMKMLLRSEVDINIDALSPGVENLENVKFSYPYGFSDVTFMTNKPEYVPMSSAIFYPFSYEIWIALAVLLITIPFIFYTLLSKIINYQRILMNVYGSLLEQSFSFEVRRNNVRLLLLAWLLGAMIVSNSYKALLLSFLSFPSIVGIRDISDLARASTERSVKCFSYPGDNKRKLFLESNIESWRKIGACLEENKIISENGTFYTETSKKALIGARYGLSYDEDIYFVSQDTFYHSMYGFAYSRKFCCPKYFNRLINRISSAGLFQKIQREEKFFFQLRRIFSTANQSEVPRKIYFSDIFAAYAILLIGWISASLVFVVEIFIHKYNTRIKYL